MYYFLAKLTVCYPEVDDETRIDYVAVTAKNYTEATEKLVDAYGEDYIVDLYLYATDMETVFDLTEEEFESRL